MKVYLTTQAMKHKDAIIAHIDHETKYNCNFNGMNYEIKEDEYNWIDDCDEIDGTFLLAQINDILERLTLGDYEYQS